MTIKQLFLATTLVAFTFTSALSAPISANTNKFREIQSYSSKISTNPIARTTKSYNRDERYQNQSNRLQANNQTFNDDNYNYPHYNNSAGFEPLIIFGFVTAFFTLLTKMLSS